MSDSSSQHQTELIKDLTRRYFFKQAGIGIGGTALSLLLRRDLFASSGRADSPTPEPNPLAPKPSMFPAKAKSVIYLFMAGALRTSTFWTISPRCNSTTANLFPRS